MEEIESREICKNIKSEDGQYQLIVQCVNLDANPIIMQLRSKDNSLSLFDMALTPSWTINSRYQNNQPATPGKKEQTDWEAKFKKGDYYQSTFAKTPEGEKLYEESLGKICHEIILENKGELSFIKNIYSTTLKQKYLKFHLASSSINNSAIHFWILQWKSDKKKVYDYDVDLGKFKLIVQ